MRAAKRGSRHATALRGAVAPHQAGELLIAAGLEKQQQGAFNDRTLTYPLPESELF
jgi:hypothetical protein